MVIGDTKKERQCRHLFQRSFYSLLMAAATENRIRDVLSGIVPYRDEGLNLWSQPLDVTIMKRTGLPYQVDPCLS